MKKNERLQSEVKKKMQKIKIIQRESQKKKKKRK
jgi:hypothetical protein